MKKMLLGMEYSYFSMVDRLAIKFSLILFFLALGLNNSLAQVSSNDISKWPKPSLENVRDSGFYSSKEKLERYYKWKKQWEIENLPPLFLKLDTTSQIISFKRQDNILHYIIDLDDKLPVVFKGEQINGQTISADSLSSFSIQDEEWLRSFMRSKDNSRVCHSLDEISSRIYIIYEVTESDSTIIVEATDCVDGFSLDEDDITEYTTRRLGDSLIIIDFKN